MNEEHLQELTISSAASEIRNGTMTPLELTEALLNRIERINSKINAYVTLLKENALTEAKNADREIKAGKYKGPLHGIPFGIKDVIDVKGVRTTASSRIFADNIPDTDATSVERLKRAGSIILGKLNTHEIALGATTNSGLFGQTKNPWDIHRIPGGSSGGSAAAVASSLCLASLGTDGGGSIRIPSALCGVVGFKPTYGRVSRYGVFPLHWSLEHVGPITKSVEDAAIVLGVIAGKDPKDGSSSPIPVPDYISILPKDLDGVRIAYIQEYTGDSLDLEVDRSFNSALKVLEKLGATVEGMSLPWISHSNLARFIIIGSEAACLLWESVSDGAPKMERDSRMFLAAGTLFSASDYLRAQRLRTELIRRLGEIFGEYDLLLSPTCPITAPRIGQNSASLGGREKSVTEALAGFCGAYNLAGVPAISVPSGFDSSGLPIGLQIAGRPFEDGLVLRTGYAYQSRTTWHRHIPQFKS